MVIILPLGLVATALFLVRVLHSSSSPRRSKEFLHQRLFLLATQRPSLYSLSLSLITNTSPPYPSPSFCLLTKLSYTPQHAPTSSSSAIKPITLAPTLPSQILKRTKQPCHELCPRRCICVRVSVGERWCSVAGREVVQTPLISNFPLGRFWFWVEFVRFTHVCIGFEEGRVVV